MWDTLIIIPFTNALLFIYTVVGQNFGVAIILFTLLIRIVTHPLMVSQIKGGQAMQELQSNPRYKEIQEKYKGDKEKLAQEQAALLKELGVNPFGSCLPLLIQFPLIIGLYQSLYKAMANTPLDLFTMTRHLYPFLDITRILPINNQFLWMDLSQPERLVLNFLPFGIPIMAIVVIYLVLAAQFESFRDPLIIMMAVPLSIFGAILPLNLGLGTLNIYTQVGLITLIGLITKHGILLVEFANQQQEEHGMSIREAIVAAARVRLRPILMTTAAMALGVVPLITAAGAGAASRYSMGLVIFTGILIGTMFTLFVVPMFYTFLAHRHEHKPVAEAHTVTAHA